MIYELRFTAPQTLDDPLSELLSSAGSMGVVIEDIGKKSVFSKSMPFECCQYKGYFEDSINLMAVELAIRSFLISHGEQGDCEIYWLPLEEQNWQESWKRHFKPLLVGKNILVLPSWLDIPKGSEQRLIIRMDPEMAFGSGTHETTRGCLEVLEIVAEKKALGRVLDMGTGSGILLIGSMLLGAESGLGIDIDPIAVETSERNCQNNLEKMENKLTFKQSETLPQETFQTVVANILLPTLNAFLTETTTQFQHCVEKGGLLLVSGILVDQATELETCACDNGFDPVLRKDIGEWSVLLLEKK